MSLLERPQRITAFRLRLWRTSEGFRGSGEKKGLFRLQPPVPLHCQLLAAVHGRSRGGRFFPAGDTPKGRPYPTHYRRGVCVRPFKGAVTLYCSATRPRRPGLLGRCHPGPNPVAPQRFRPDRAISQHWEGKREGGGPGGQRGAKQGCRQRFALFSTVEEKLYDSVRYSRRKTVRLCSVQ
eukprot:1483590-Pyramimonas_sp.AAC.3